MNNATIRDIRENLNTSENEETINDLYDRMFQRVFDSYSIGYTSASNSNMQNIIGVSERQYVNPGDQISVQGAVNDTYTVESVNGNNLTLAGDLPLTTDTITINSPSPPNSMWNTPVYTPDINIPYVPYDYKSTSPSKQRTSERETKLDLALTTTLITLKQILETIPDEAKSLVLKEISNIEDVLNGE